MKMKPAFLFFILLQFCTFSLTDAAANTYWSYPPSVTGIQGQNITITFVANLSDHASGTTWKLVRITKDGNRVIHIKPGEQKVVYSPFDSRSSDFDLNVTQNGVIVTIKLTYSNLVKATDEGAYTVNPFGTSDFEGGVPGSPVSLTINAPPKISRNTSPIIVNETQTAQLVCTASGHPTPSINWTRDGVIVGTGSPFTTPAVTFNDDKACYTCVAYNGVLDAKTANVCLNVQYKPRSTLSLVSAKSTVNCQNDTVSLTCTSGPANPAPSSYEFYNNGVLIGSSASNVYEATATVGLPAINKFVCVPRNLLGAALKNASVEVSAEKVAPNFSNITITEASVAVVWGNLHFPQKTMVTCWLNVKESPHGLKWMTSSNTSYGSSISCFFSGLQPTTLYRIRYALSIHENYVNGTIFVATPYKGVTGSSHPTSNGGRSSTAFIAVIVVAAVIILLLILVVIWMRFQDRQKNRRTNSEEQNMTEVQLQTFEADYENEGFVFRDTQADGNMVLYEQVQNRDLTRNQGVDSAPSIPVENIPGNPEQFEREGRATAADIQSQSKYQESSYQSIDPREVEAGKRVDDIQDSYGHLVGFTRRPGHNASSEDQNPYQELQPENRSSREYQSLQKMQRTAFNV